MQCLPSFDRAGNEFFQVVFVQSTSELAATNPVFSPPVTKRIESAQGEEVMAEKAVGSNRADAAVQADSEYEQHSCKIKNYFLNINDLTFSRTKTVPKCLGMVTHDSI